MTEQTTAMASARIAGYGIDGEFASACFRAGINFREALIGSPLLNLHIARHRKLEADKQRKWQRRAA